ncbi:hypothetical protein FB451DRAFT_1418635 [Mycena latifolia]|nr:hypothetical protein FB451DRAFT_1418635 [Mycena latifolia]
MSPSTTAPACRRFPVETWTQIFEDLPRDAISQVHRVDWLFHRIARPLLFREFKFHPYGRWSFAWLDWDSPSALYLPHPVQIQLLLQRLEFWSSHEIAPLIRVCHMTPWDNNVDEPLGWEFTRGADPYVLLRAFFDSLPRFTNLRRLDATLVPFTDIAIQHLCILPKLTHLMVEECTIVEDVVNLAACHRLAVPSFVFRHHKDVTDHERWLRLLDPDALRYLQVTYDPELFAQIRSGDPFPRVNTLKMGWGYGTTTLNLDVLSKFPAIQILAIEDAWLDVEPMRDSEIVQASRVLTHLKEYTGPHTLCPFAIPTLHRLTFPPCSPSDLLESLCRQKPVSNITSLNLEFAYFDTAILKELCRYSSNLVELRLAIQMIPKEEDFDGFYEFEATTMQKLAIHWGSLSEPDPQPEPQKVIESLLSKHPTMKSIWLHPKGLMFLWRQRFHDVHSVQVLEGDDWNAHSRFDEFELLWLQA